MKGNHLKDDDKNNEYLFSICSVQNLYKYWSTLAYINSVKSLILFIKPESVCLQNLSNYVFVLLKRTELPLLLCLFKTICVVQLRVIANLDYSFSFLFHFELLLEKSTLLLTKQKW